jgi:hypothetical protein
LPATVTIAIDTEFEETNTLCVQAAVRTDAHTLAVQLYRSQAIPDLPPSFQQERYLPITAEKNGRFCEQILVRPVKPLTVDLSPARMVRDLLALSGVEVRSRVQGWSSDGQLDPFSPWQPANTKWNKRTQQFDVPAVLVVLVGHFLRADYFRIFGRNFLDTLRPQPQYMLGGVVARARKLLYFVEQAGKRLIKDPTLEYLRAGDNAFAVRLRTRDTSLPYGKGSLEAHSQTFIGLGKSDTLSEEDKKHMTQTFQARTADAYGYAMVDVINTLLVYEAMVAKDGEISKAFGLPG